jgi:hypothetical protein
MSRLSSPSRSFRSLGLVSEREAYDELCAYTAMLGDVTFIHQHVVDAFAAQTADEHTKPITLAFALVGLCLHVERDFTGREVQLAHMRMARRKRVWPSFMLPRERGSITAIDVLAREPGPTREAAIHSWTATVWDAFRASKPAVEELLSHYKIGQHPARKT